METVSKNPIVAFDESGNTGQDLLNKDQPIFTLASVCFSDEEARRLINSLSSQQAQEIKFSRLKRRESGQKRIIEFLQSNLITQDRVKITPFHKGFVVVTKVVDLLIEPLERSRGVDIYKKGLNMALSNMHYFCMRTLCGQEKFDEFRKRFVAMIREKSLKSIDDFYNYISELLRASNYDNYNKHLMNILATKDFIGDEVIRSADITSLDPAPSAFVLHCQVWSKQLGREFDAIHDESRPVEHMKTFFSYLMAKDEPETEVGYDRRKFIFPLKTLDINFCNSKSLPQLQIADIFASAYTYWAGGKIGQNVDKKFSDALEKTSLPNLIFGGVWPIPAFSPEELETTESGGISTLDYVNELVERQSKKKQG